MANVSGYDEDPYAKLMYDAGWVPAPRLDAHTTIPKPTEMGSVLILGGKSWVPGGNALRGTVLRRYLETFMGPLDQKVDVESFVDSAKQLGIVRKEVTPITIDPFPKPTELAYSTKQEEEYQKYLERLKKAKTLDETIMLGKDFLSRWR